MIFIVDDANIKAKNGRSTRRWFHLTVIPQDEEALKGFGRKVGLNPKYIQKPPKSSFIHFVITAGMRNKILKAGATQLTNKEMQTALKQAERIQASEPSKD